jgi:NADPH:quinone reductase-like Zn-dependent oxidoreductase
MKAIIYTPGGSPEGLRFNEVATPTPAQDEVLVKLHAAALNPLDKHFTARIGPLFLRLLLGRRAPKNHILGSDIAGRVEAVGKDVRQFRPGDEVFGGIVLGGFAEYACAMEDRLALKPANISFEDAAAVPIAAVTALQGLRDKGRIRPGQKVLVDGASGGVGTFAIQIAKSFGAEVTAVCSTNKMDQAVSIGADHVIDYTREDFTRSGLRYDLILGANAHHSLLDYRRALSHDGICVLVGGGGGAFRFLQAMLVGTLLSLVGNKKVITFMAKLNKEDLVFLKDLLAGGKVVPVIDRSYPLSDAAKAISYLGEGHARGKIVLTVEHDNKT